MNYRCPRCESLKNRKHGQYVRKSDSKTIYRFKCSNCYHTFSNASFSSCYRQHKRRINPIVAGLLSSGVSQRRCGILLGVTRKTIARKLRHLAKLARERHEEMLSNISARELFHIQMDDLITSHHSKLKPLSLSVVISKNSRKILGSIISEIPAFGPLAKISRKKYGRRSNDLHRNLDELFGKLSQYLPSEGIIDSDEHKAYAPVIKKHLSRWKHCTYKSQRASIAGQGELKIRAFDPLFNINHTLAMLRANINRLFRRTWNTTKKPESLMDHFWIFSDFYNKKLIKP